MRFSRSKPGFVISAAVHAGLLVAALVVFSDAKKFEDAQEFVPVEIVSETNQTAKGEKTAKPAKPAARIDKVAETPLPAPRPPLDEAKKEVPTPPPPLKRLAEPSEAEKETPPTPPKRVAAAPPPPPVKEALAKQPPKPAPRPAPEPPIKAAPPPEKEEPREAEVVRPKPPTKPKEPITKPAPPATPKAKPQDTETPEKTRAKAEPRLKVDEVAKLLQQKKRQEKAEDNEAADDKPEKPAKPKSGDETAPKTRFDPTSIANLLSHEKPQQHAAAGPEKTRVASLGAPTAAGPKLSPSMQAKIDSYTVEHYRRCWAAGLSLDGRAYTPRVEFRLTQDGALDGAPRLLNPSSNPTDRSRAEQALAAVRRCSPMPIPPDFVAYYDYWQVTELDMKEDM